MVRKARFTTPHRALILRTSTERSSIDDHADSFAAAARTISEHVPICSIVELQRAAEASQNTDGAVLAKLGLASAPELDEKTASLITAGLASSARNVREGAIYAPFLLEWPAFQQPIIDAHAREDHDDLRRMLEAAATVCDPSWPGFATDDRDPQAG